MQSTLEEKMLDNADNATKIEAKHPGRENVSQMMQIMQQRWLQSIPEEKMLDNTDESTKMDAKHPGKENAR